MDGYNVGQLIIVGVLVLITAYYAYQTRRQANLLKEQIAENQRIQKAEKRERLLNEIIEWVTGIIEWNIDTSFEAKRELKEAKEPFMVILMQLFRFSEGFRQMKRKGKLTIHPFIITLNSKSLTDAIDTLLKGLQTQIELGGFHEMALMEDINAKTQTLSNKFNLAETQVINHKKLLDETAEKVVEEAVKIKTRDIS